MANKEATLLLRIKSKGEEVLNNISESFSAMSGVALGALAAVGAALYKGITSYHEQEQAVNSLNRAMANSGVFSAELRDKYLEQANALSKVTQFEDEQIIKAQAIFSQQARGIKLTEENTRAILDFAQAQGVDLSTAASLVAKSISTSTNALSRYGIEINSNATQSEKMSQVMEKLNGKFGGQAEAATKGLGVFGLLKKSFDDLLKSVGEQLSPAITMIGNDLMKLVSDTSGISSFVDAISSGFNFIVKSAYFVVYSFEQVGKTIGGTLGTIIGAIDLLVRGQFTAAKDALIGGFNDVTTQMQELSIKHQAKMAEIDALDTARQHEKSAGDLQLLLDSKAAENTVKEENALAEQEKELQRTIEFNQAKTDMELALISGRESAKYAAEAAAADKRYQLAQTQAEKTKALQDKYNAMEMLNQAKIDEAKIQQAQSTLGYISGLQSSKNKEMAAVGRAAAIANATIEGYRAVQSAFAWGMSIGGPPLAAAFGGAAAVTTAANIAKIAGVELAEGGIVMPRPGGTRAIIGEAGQAEAVIPLDRAGEFGLGGGGNNIIINVQGGLLGSESEAREFAMAIDKELYKLRKNNESVSFDRGVV